MSRPRTAMARQNIYKFSPNTLKIRRKSTFKLPKRSPLTSRLNRVRALPIGGNRFFHTHSKLRPIREEHSDVSADLRRDFGANEDTFADRDDANSEDETGIFDWEEEDTLVAALMRDELVECDQRVDLANSLQGAMSRQSFKQYIAEILVPACTVVKDAYTEVDQKIEISFAEGIVAFDDASKDMEILVIKEEDEIKTSYLKTRKNLEKLFIQLDQLYNRRETLWTDLQETLKQSAEHVLAEINAFPAAIERKISILDKISKDKDKDTGESSKQEKMLKLLAKYA